MAANFPDPPWKNTMETARVIEPGKPTGPSPQCDPWILTVSASENVALGRDGALPR